MWTCRLRPLGLDIVVGCAPVIAPDIEHQFGWARPEVSAEPPPPGCVCLDVSPGTPPHASHALRHGDALLVTVARLDDLLVQFQHWLDAEVTRRATHLTPLHAGVIAISGHAILLPGRSRSGKTTLVGALIDQGATYASDELAFLDADGRVHPYPRHRLVRAEGSGHSTAVPVDTLIAEDLLPIGLVVGLHFERGAEFRVERVPSSEGVLLLLANTAHRLSPGGPIPPGIVRAGAQAVIYRGVRGEAVAAAEAILRLARDHPRA